MNVQNVLSDISRILKEYVKRLAQIVLNSQLMDSALGVMSDTGLIILFVLKMRLLMGIQIVPNGEINCV